MAQSAVGNVGEATRHPGTLRGGHFFFLSVSSVNGESAPLLREGLLLITIE